MTSPTIPNESRPSVPRRTFLKGAIAASALTAISKQTGRAQQPPSRTPSTLKAAVIGHTGKGDYGHGHDLIFNDLPNVEVVAVADPVAAGRAKAAQRCRAARQYDDYREMLAKEKPHLVSVALRWTDQHYAMAKAVLLSGAHLYLEKPMTQTLAEADDLLATANKAGLKIVVAHQMRLSPSVRHLKTALDRGLIGDLLAIRAHGKQDSRAGGEDMMVLGTHLFDLTRYLAGDALWCTARVLQKGRDIARSDGHAATENIGLIAGDEIEASFAFPNGVNVSFTSRGKNRQTAGPWGLELIGSQGVVRILTEIVPSIFHFKAGDWAPAGRSGEWRPLPDDPTVNWSAAERGFGPANRRLVDDWLDAIRTDRNPVCGGLEGMKAIEMVMAVYEAALAGSRVPLPLARRTHPLQA